MILLFLALSHAQIVETLHIDFEKTTTKHGKEEFIRGTIYFQQPDAMCMIITEPVNQWIFSGRDTMVLFYPEDSLAFKFYTIFPVTFPFFQAFLGIVQEDYGLTAIGYTLAEHEVNDSILTTIWAPPKDAPGNIGTFRITYTNDRITSAAYLSTDSSIISRTMYHSHFPHGAYFFPMEIEKIQFAEQDTVRELIKYAHPEFNCVLPDTLMNFRLPVYVTTEQIQWQ
ncbi:hypothetical protein JXB22_02855 [candidate division WOR-3 bacterium]|nr:hypothetical protein [candidate division WOR-3 bacterium]